MPTAREREHIMQRARELANSGEHPSWESVERELRATRRIQKRDSTLEDYFLRGELDARCWAARNGRPMS